MSTTKKLITTLAVLSLGFGVFVFINHPIPHQTKETLSQQSSKIIQTSTQNNANPPSQALADSVMTDNVKNQLGSQITYNGHGAYIINNNQNDLNADVNTAPYAVNKLDSQGRTSTGDALLNPSSRQKQDRNTTNNGATSWHPEPWDQKKLNGTYKNAWDRGHLLGYALVGNIKNFDASESNHQNIATQTAWSNRASDDDNTGQGYYEKLVRQYLDGYQKNQTKNKNQSQNRIVRYRVTNIYDGNNPLASGTHLEAKSQDGTLQFNVFVPNVQNGLSINYTNGQTTVQ